MVIKANKSEIVLMRTLCAAYGVNMNKLSRGKT